jgi:hypothetical protein
MLSKLSASQVANTHIIQFSGSHNHGCQLGHSTGTINWTGGPTEVEHGAYGMGPVNSAFYVSSNIPGRPVVSTGGPNQDLPKSSLISFSGIVENDPN